MMQELQIVINQKLGTISTNFEEVKETLSAQMEIYKELAVTEANKTERKKDIATLRKVIKSVNDKRIEVKKECMKPYALFEEKASELINIINTPIGIIDNQVKEFEDKQRLLKIQAINEAYDSLIGDLVDNLPLDKIYSSAWENTATTIKSIKAEMAVKIEEVDCNAKAICAMVSDKTEEVLEEFWEDLNLAKAIKKITDYEDYKNKIVKQQEEKQRIQKEHDIEQQRLDNERALERERERVRNEERNKIHEEERIRSEERDKALALQQAQENKIREDERVKAYNEQQAIIEAEREALAVHKQETLSTVETNIFSITATPEETSQIEMYLDSLGIDWERMC